MKPTPTTDAIIGFSLNDERLKEYHWDTSIRITQDGSTIDEVRDIIDAPVEGLYSRDDIGVIVTISADASDPRHSAVRGFDSRVWEYLLGRHSPQEEVKAARRGIPAEWIATMLIEEYPDHARLIMQDEGLTEQELHASLTRTLRYDGGAE